MTIVLAAGTARRAAAATPAEDAARLSWLAGCWSGTAEGVVTEEHWTSPAGGVLLGMNKAVANGKLASFEHLRIAPHEGRLCYLASPQGGAVTPFCAVEVGDRRVVFENREHDFPQRILYWREGEKLHARVEGTLDGKPAGDEWEWGRCSG
ncbi:MAG TPA: DUF6265 family protein [Thermoanaerobaculia bacterium]|nr:DUF6265 family protein [Thermoanaerobaculia bacterium]